MRSNLRHWSVVALAVVAGCGGAPPPVPREPEPDPDRDPDTVARRIRDALADMTAAAEAHAGDCPGMAPALVAVFDRVRPVFARVTALRQDPDRERDLTRAFKVHGDEAATLNDRLFAAIAPCRDEPAVGDAIAQMPDIQ